MKMKFAELVVVGLLVGTLAAEGQNTYQPGLVPNAKQQFTDANGAPLSGGKVYFYVPGTTTPSPTYQDPQDTILNSNPILLDSAGRGIVWGTGSYRQIVRDQFGNLIWDQTTSQTNLASVGCPGGEFGQFQFFTQSGPSPNCAGASGLTTSDVGASVALNAVDENVQGVGGLNIFAGTTGSNQVDIHAGNGAGSGQGGQVNITGGATNDGGTVAIQAGDGDTPADGGEITLNAPSQINASTTCTQLNLDGIGSGGVPTNQIFLEAGNGNSGCDGVGGGTVTVEGNLQVDGALLNSVAFVDNPTSGATVGFADSQSYMEIVPTGTLSTLTIQLPTCSAAYNGKIAVWSTTKTISTATVTATAGSIVESALGTINAFGGMYFVCRGSNTTWYQMSFGSGSP